MKIVDILKRNLNNIENEEKTTKNLIKLSTGNAKLQQSGSYDFLIFNISAIRTCPYATELCKKSCYAMKAEALYPNAMIARERNYTASTRNDFVETMIEIISKKVTKATKNGKTILFRIHESGDFYSQEYFDKWNKIANHFIGKSIIFYAYTKSIKFINTKSSNIKILFSVWDDTNTNDIEKAKQLDIPVFTVIEKSGWDKLDNSQKCPGTDCAKCQKCVKNNNKSIYVLKH